GRHCHRCVRGVGHQLWALWRLRDGPPMARLRFNIGHRFNSCLALGDNSLAEDETKQSEIAALIS
ncbi:MAG: hypothetical protein WAN52_18125, partial [Pseudolabrys sp.]